MTRWDDVNARARGLAGHLLNEPAIQALGRCGDLSEVAACMRADGIAVAEGTADAAALDLAARRDAAVYLDLLARWSGPRSDLLALVMEDGDRRSIRALLRGADQGAAPDRRLAGLVPTPSLPAGALAELARQPGVAAVAALLAAWRHPLGAPLLPEAAGEHPRLTALERALNRAFFARALRLARRSGRRGPLAAEVRLAIDAENTLSAIALAGQDRSLAPGDLFLPGGTRVTSASFEQAAARATAALAARDLAACFRGTAIATALREGAADAAGMDRRVLRARLAMLEAARRRDPLGPATVLGFMLRLRLQLLELRRAIWRAALGQAPAAAARGFS